MLLCAFCNFTTENDDEYKRHRRRAECIQSKTILFVCKRCDFTGHSMKKIKAHECQKMYYEHNIVEDLRNVQSASVLTTKARTEWVKFKKLIKQLPKDFHVLNTKKLLHCQHLNINPFVVVAILEYQKWLNPDSCDLGALSVENVHYLKNHLHVAHRYFDYTIHRQIDASHFFALLLAKTESMFWPFLLTISEVVHLVFGKQNCPIKRDFSGNFYILQSTDDLQDPLLDTIVYTNFVWKKATSGDLFRFIHYKFIERLFDNIIQCDFDDDKIKDFINFWDDEYQVCNSIPQTERVPTSLNFEFNQMHVPFKSLVKQHGTRGETCAQRLEMSSSEYPMSKCA